MIGEDESGLSGQSPADTTPCSNRGVASVDNTKLKKDELSRSDKVTAALAAASVLVALASLLTTCTNADMSRAIVQLSNVAAAQQAQVKELANETGAVRAQTNALDNEVGATADIATNTARLVGPAERTAAAAQIDAQSAQDQLALNRDSQRAWLTIEPRIAGDLRYVGTNLVGVPLNYKLTNEGHAPAFRIEIQAEPVHPTDQIEAQERDLCQKLKPPMPAEPGYGAILFPGKEIGDWNSANEHTLVWADMDRSHALEGLPPNYDEFQIWMIGCVAYDFGDIRDRHHTGFIYRIGQTIDTRIGKAELSQFKWGEPVPQERLLMNTGWPQSSLAD
jgi:hypothetical protein